MTTLSLMWGTVLGVAVLTVIALLAADFGRSSATPVSAPTAPPDCVVTDEPTVSGPQAPGSLTTTHLGGPLNQVRLNWIDNSHDETCFVIEAREGDDYAPIAFVSANIYQFVAGPYAEGDYITYRIYAADETGRSGLLKYSLCWYPVLRQPFALSPGNADAYSTIDTHCHSSALSDIDDNSALPARRAANYVHRQPHGNCG